jgi:hypothetical protein
MNTPQHQGVNSESSKLPGFLLLARMVILIPITAGLFTIPFPNSLLQYLRSESDALLLLGIGFIWCFKIILAVFAATIVTNGLHAAYLWMLAKIQGRNRGETI